MASSWIAHGYRLPEERDRSLNFPNNQPLRKPGAVQENRQAASVQDAEAGLSGVSVRGSPRSLCILAVESVIALHNYLCGKTV